jgi:hypothetical protein
LDFVLNPLENFLLSRPVLLLLQFEESRGGMGLVWLAGRGGAGGEGGPCGTKGAHTYPWEPVVRPEVTRRDQTTSTGNVAHGGFAGGASQQPVAPGRVNLGRRDERMMALCSVAEEEARMRRNERRR